MKRFVQGCGATLASLALMLLCFGLGFVAHAWQSGAIEPGGVGPAVAASDETAPLSEAPANFALFYEALGLLRGEFFGELPEGEQLPYAAIRGVLGRLEDPNTIFVEPAAHEREQEQFQGEFGGIGAQISADEQGRIVIVAPIPETPAARADLRANDVLLEADGQPLTGMTPDQAATTIRGPVGSDVTLRVQRGDEQFSVTITREKIPDPTVDHRLIEGTSVGYIQLRFFSARTTDELRAAIEALQGQGATHYIVDLRNNPGGLLSAAVGTSSLFLPDGLIAFQQKRDGSRDELRTDGPPLLTEAPMVVLINEGSASASEILAGALQARGRATLVGSQSYGKGTVQIPYTLSDGSSLHVTIAHWLTPSGTDLSAEGLTPDLPIQPTEEQRQAGVDPVLDAALQLLTESP